MAWMSLRGRRRKGFLLEPRIAGVCLMPAVLSSLQAGALSERHSRRLTMAHFLSQALDVPQRYQPEEHEMDRFYEIN